MIVNLHIERLVLDGVAAGAGDGTRIEAAVRSELTRLWSQAGAAGLPKASAAVPALRGAALTASAPLGTAIARSVYGSITT